ncbi:MAG: hypothetical protein GX884_04745 [Chloroflexi bacterium]|jgi:hypothetical protein|nr:hypothetical protein [Chloroflexota bacterium]
MNQKETTKEEIETLEESAINDASSIDESQKDEKSSKGVTIALVALALLFAIIVAGSIILAKQNPRSVATVRDIFIILMALMLVVIGTSLIILILQVSNLINILKNDIKPMLDSGAETVNTLKGTVRFISDNLAEPVIKLNESLASLKKVGQLFKLFKD